MKKPSVELSDCIFCGVCAEVSPDAFRVSNAGYIEIIELESYPENEVNEAIKYCPTDCISWADDD